VVRIVKARLPSARRLVPIAGGVAAVACIGFFLKALFEAAAGLPPGAVGGNAILATLLLCPCYGLILLLLAKSWQILLRSAGPRPAPECRLVATYALTQFAKYVPGNVFHLAGRHAVLTKKGFSQRSLLVSTLHENLVLILSATCLGAVLLILFPGASLTAALHGTGVPPVLLSPAARTVSAIAVLGAVTWIAAATFRRFARVDIRRPLILDGIFFAAQGLFFVLLLHAVSGEFHPEALGVITVSWLVGFLTPGAPGGVGVREIAILFLLKGSVQPEEAVLAAGLYRLVSFGGDLLFFGYGVLCKGPDRRDADASVVRASRGKSAPPMSGGFS
jgi:uncharacterized membrane protein YbhN (UPF0104 family)